MKKKTKLDCAIAGHTAIARRLKRENRKLAERAFALETADGTAMMLLEAEKKARELDRKEAFNALRKETEEKESVERSKEYWRKEYERVNKLLDATERDLRVAEGFRTDEAVAHAKTRSDKDHAENIIYAMQALLKVGGAFV